MHELRALEAQLKALREQCREASTAGDCGILNQLSRQAGSGSRRPVRGRHGAGASRDGR